MARVIAILNQKGGAGKTTISTNLAYCLKREGAKVLLADSDPQGSSRDWSEANAGELLPVVGLDRETLAKDLPAIAGGYDWVVIDGAPLIAKLSAAAVRVADIVVIPVQPSPYDIWSCADLVDIIKVRQEVGGGKPKAVFLISRAIKGTKLSGEVRKTLTDYGLPVLAARTTQRVVYPTTAAEGKTVFDGADPGAIAEISAIKTEVLEVLHGTQG